MWQKRSYNVRYSGPTWETLGSLLSVSCPCFRSCGGGRRRQHSADAPTVHADVATTPTCSNSALSSVLCQGSRVRHVLPTAALELCPQGNQHPWELFPGPPQAMQSRLHGGHIHSRGGWAAAAAHLSWRQPVAPWPWFSKSR